MKICCIVCVFLWNTGLATSQECGGRNVKKLPFFTLKINSDVPVDHLEPGGFTPLYSAVNLFLSLVQPNPFPEGIVRSLVNNATEIQVSEVVRYGGGYIACAVIGILYLVFMLVFGIIYCVFQFQGRRTLGNCNSIFCTKLLVFMGLLMTCAALFAGIVCTFIMNQKTQEEFAPGVQKVAESLQEFQRSTASLPLALREIVYAFSIPKKKVLDELQSFGPDIYTFLNVKLNQDIFPLLQNSLQTAKQLKEAAQTVVDVNLAVKRLQQRQRNLEVELSSHRQKLERTLTDPQCHQCNPAIETINQVQLRGNFSRIQSLDGYVNKLTNVRKINLTGIFTQGIQVFSEMPKLLSTQTSESISDTIKAIDTIENQINSSASRLPIQQYTDQINKALLEAEEKTLLYGKEAERYEYYRWALGIAVCSVLLLIMIFTLLGLLFGICGLRLQQDPAKVYMTFCFSWLLIILVFTTFVVGGNMQTLLCKPWANGDLYKFLDEPTNLPSHVNLREQLGLRNNINFTDMYQECKTGAPIWDIWNVNDPTDMIQSINIATYTAEIQDKIDSFTVDLTGLEIITNISLRVLADYSNSGIDRAPYNAILNEIQPPLMTTDLGLFASSLESLVTVQDNATIRHQLQNEADALRGINNSTAKELKAEMADINRTIDNVKTLQGGLVKDIIQILKNESICLVRRAIGYFTQYLHWVTKMIKMEISSCRSVPRTLDNVRVAVCNYVTDPWNGFWFCLGWCTVLLIPNIILSIKSAEHITYSKPTLCPDPAEENLVPLQRRRQPDKSHPVLPTSERTSELL
ncbi:hypothetical protein GDO86_006600 [Hymenochirus boettgeri]|uniref:Prominin 2 n=1 Tax=Hymenochirus boettgeri TaxID=247094 RepID=A0A8T2J995_9PIPI|nr:hypothetical protein GDO86_006600 [Hymenochirus boettgeri]